MKLIKPSFEIIDQPEGVFGVDKMVEIAGRTCYKSEDKMTEDSAIQLTERMLESGHTAMLEHGTVYLLISHEKSIDIFGCNWVEVMYGRNPYSYISRDKQNYYVTTNLRVLHENRWLKDMKYLCEPTEHHVKRVTVRFICDRGVSHEFVRHRVFSFAQESTRFCNYGKNKFGNELTFIIPNWVDPEKLSETHIISHDEYGSLISEYYFHLTGEDNGCFGSWEITPESNFIASLQVAEQLYMELLKQGWSPQQARSVLPNALKTELVMTGTTEQWEGFFKLRDDKKHAHPQAYELAHPLHEEFKRRGLCTS